MGARAIERRWARTLALRAESSPDPEAVFAEAARLGEAVARDGRIAALLRDPRIREASKAKALVDCDPARGAEMRAFLLFLASRGRTAFLPGILAALRDETDRRRGIVRATVWSADPLDEERLGRLRAWAERREGMKCELEARIDPGVIGGFRMRLGDEMVDCSLRRQLDLLRRRLGE